MMSVLLWIELTMALMKEMATFKDDDERHMMPRYVMSKKASAQGPCNCKICVSLIFRACSLLIAKAVSLGQVLTQHFRVMASAMTSCCEGCFRQSLRL